MDTYNWDSLKSYAKQKLIDSHYDGVYIDRLNFEFSEIEKQGVEYYWIDIANTNTKFDKNPNMLVLPWIMGFCPDIDPIKSREDEVPINCFYKYISELQEKNGKLPQDIIRDMDFPDIDLDCLPESRDKIKDYAQHRYGQNNVASVGTWQTLLFKRALGDSYTTLGYARNDKNKGWDDKNTKAIKLTKDLPDDVNFVGEGGFGRCTAKVIQDGKSVECGHKHNKSICPKCGGTTTDVPTISMLFDEFEELKKFNDEYPDVVDLALKLVGKIRNQGKHAGAIIISDRDLFGNVPMKYDNKSKQWISMWTEGARQTLSSYGYIKWDILGLKSLGYIYHCCKTIEQNHDVVFGKAIEGLNKNVDFAKRQAGIYWKINENGEKEKHIISMDDEKVLSMAHNSMTDAIFQFDTPLAKRILRNGVSSIEDMQAFNALGHPGPMACVPADTKINTDKGLVNITNLDSKKHKIKFLSNDGFSYTDEYVVGFSGTKQLYEINLSNGKSFRATEDHRVLTQRGYKKICDLSCTDKIAVDSEIAE